jgi:hypothetical protein
MKKRKVILLPDDERILNLFQGNVGGVKEDEEEKVIKKSTPKKQNAKLTWYEIVIEKTVIALLMPFLLATVLIMIPVVLIGFFILNNEQGNRLAEQWTNLLELFLKLVPYRNRGNFNNIKNTRWKGEEEDIPGFLSRAKTYQYERIVYTKNIDEVKKEALEKIQSAGMIDGVLTYTNDNELFTYIKNNDIDQLYSWIVNVFEFDIKFSTDAFKNILFINKTPVQIQIYSNHFNTFKNGGYRMIFSRIKLIYHPILDQSTVLYFEKHYEPEVNAYIKKNYLHIQQELDKKGFRLLYFPSVKQLPEAQNNFAEIVSYEFADLHIGDERVDKKHIEKWIHDFDVDEIYAFIESTFQIPELPLPAFIRCLSTLDASSEGNLIEYSFFPIWGREEGLIHQEVTNFLSLVGQQYNEPAYRLVGRHEIAYDADEWFGSDGSELNDDIKEKIAAIKKHAGEQKVFETLFYVINEFRDVNPDLCRKLCKQLYEESGKIEKKLSRLRVDKFHRIFLTDYGNVEIEMTPLPKTLFLFMLKYPNGIMLKELYKHKQELLYIYGRISNRTDMSQMQQSINDMTDATSNSINEKCSRIKEAFVSKVDERIAESYYITGSRQEPKRVMLDRNLVIFEEVL